MPPKIVEDHVTRGQHEEMRRLLANIAVRIEEMERLLAQIDTRAEAVEKDLETFIGLHGAKAILRL
jgi:hypothetical protein